MRIFVLLLISVMLAAGCTSVKYSDENIIKEEASLRVDEIDNNRYMISESIHGALAARGNTSFLKNLIRKKAMDHCKEQGKAFTLISMTGGGGSFNQASSTSFGLATGAITGVSAGAGDASGGSGADVDLIFSCRERTTPAPTTDAPKDAP